MSTVTASSLPVDEYPEWAALLADSPDGTIYSDPDYLDALCTAAGGRFRVVGVRRGAELVGGVAAYERDGAGGVYVRPRLLLYFNGVVLRRYDSKYPSQQTSRDLSACSALIEHLDASGYGSVMLKSAPSFGDARPFQACGWRESVGYTYLVPTVDRDAMWDRVDKNLRRLVSRAEEEGYTITEDDDVDSLWRLHYATMERHDGPLYLPREALGAFVKRLRAAGRALLFHARDAAGRAVASQLVLVGPAGRTHTVMAGADDEYQNQGTSAFLRWKALEQLSTRGAVYNDLTDAALNSVTRFKSQMGGDLVMHLTLESPVTRRYRLATAAGDAAATGRRLAAAAVRRVLPRAAR